MAHFLWKDLLQIFSLEKKILSQTMSASFKGFYKAAKFYSQKPQVYSSVSEADKNVVFPLFLYTFPGAAIFPELTYKPSD